MASVVPIWQTPAIKGHKARRRVEGDYQPWKSNYRFTALPKTKDEGEGEHWARSWICQNSHLSLPCKHNQRGKGGGTGAF